MQRNVNRRPPLERLLAPVAPPKVDSVPGSGEPEWLVADGWRLLVRPGAERGSGELIERFSRRDGEALHARFDPDTGSVTVPFDVSEAYLNYIQERWRDSVQAPALSPGQLGLFYRLKRFIPRSAQIGARRLLVKAQKDPEFPRWPLDDSVHRLLSFHAKCLLFASGGTQLPFRWFWPDGHRAALLLTHDVESAAGLRLAVDLADLEEQRGLRSSFNIVGNWYPIDWAIVDELRVRGFELGVHGIRHDRSMFASRENFEAQLPQVAAMAERLGATGFRSPATHRVVDWLGELPVDYDCSIPHSDPFEPQPGGCCTLWPFFIGDVVELPYSLPQDHTLFTLLGHKSIDVWRGQVERIEELNGLVQAITHPDPGDLGDPAKRALYVEFLDFVREREGLWKPLPRDVADWWRVRDSGEVTDSRLGLGVVRLDGETVVFEPSVRGAVPVERSAAGAPE
jgi:peptidoglycan/xylan/chitin deacetylase (PgdA/CDA1 family)